MEGISAGGAGISAAVPSYPSAQESGTPDIREMIREAKAKADERRESLKLKNNPRYGDAPMEAYARLSRARTQAEVSAAAGYARRRLAQFQSALRRDSDNAERIRAAMGQLQKAIQRAGKKKRDLEQERCTKIRQAKAQQKKKTREAARLSQELRRKQAMRAIRETGYLREADIDNRLQDQLAQTRMELRAQAQALSAAFGPSLDAAAQAYSAQAAPAAASTPETISVEA